MATAAPQLLTLSEAALALRCSVHTVRRLLEDGELQAIRLRGPGSAVRIRLDDLEAFLNQREA